MSEIDERPRDPRRSADVAVGGLMARLADAGIVGVAGRPTRPSQRSLATFGGTVAVFMTVAISMWSQLDIAQSWSPPTASATRTGIVIMTVALFMSVGVGAIGAGPVAWRVAVAATRGTQRGIRRPALSCGVGIGVLVTGGLYFRGGWARPGPHALGAPVAGWHGVAAFLWASTLAVSAYWAHPAVLFGFPATEIAWMIVSPLALIAAVIGAARAVRQLDLPPGTLRLAGYTARAVSVGLGGFLIGTLVWLLDGGPGPGNLFQAGTVDVIGLIVMAVTLGLAARCVDRINQPRALTMD